MTKTIALAIAAFMAMAVPAAAQHAGHGDHAAAPAPATVEGTGVVKRIDAKASTAVIDHDPIKALNWPAMTMTFKFADKALLDQLKPGAKIRFDLQGQTITAVRPY